MFSLSPQYRCSKVPCYNDVVVLFKYLLLFTDWSWVGNQGLDILLCWKETSDRHQNQAYTHTHTHTSTAFRKF